MSFTTYTKSPGIDEIDLEWDYELKEPKTYVAPVQIANQRHMCLDKFPNLPVLSGATKLNIRYYIEFEIELPTVGQFGQRLIEMTFTQQSRVDALTKNVSYEYSEGGGATLEPTIYCIDHDKYNNVFKGSFIAYHNDDLPADGMQIETVYMERGYDFNDKTITYVDEKGVYADGSGAYPNARDMSTALAPMLYIANEGGTIAQGETICIVRKLRWKGMVYGDDTFNKLPRISEYDSRIINRNNYNNERVPFVNAQGKLQTGNITNSELDFLSGLTSNVQDQLNTKQFAEIGDIKSSLKTANHNGWFAFNGQAVSSLSQVQRGFAWDLGFFTSIPNLNGHTLVCSTDANSVGTPGGSNTIERGNLPNVDITVSGTTGDNDVDHSHTTAAFDVTSTADQTGMISGMAVTEIAFMKKYSSSLGEDDVRVDFGEVGGLSGVVSDVLDFATINQAATHSHTVSIPAKTSGSNSVKHKHGYSSTFNLNDGVTQVDFTPAHLKVMFFVYLGIE